MVSGFGYYWWSTNSKAISDDSTPVSFIVTKGKSASQVGQLLYSEGLIKNPLAFKIYVQVTGKSGSIQAGEFELNKTMTLPEIVDAFGKGPLELWVTIPEGLRKEEVVEKIIEGLEMDVTRASTFRTEFLSLSKSKEGYLFPNTYLFPRDVTAEKVISRLTELFDDQTDEFTKAFVNGKTKEGLTLDEVVTLASIIEREAITDVERPVIAGIYLNRLDIGMALQADATTQYAIANDKCEALDKCPDWWPILTREDLEISSPYNTYKYTGLPPTPIANPGLTSIEAAVYTQNSDYLYYIHDTDGVIHYARTLPEHNANVRKYLNK